MNLASYRLPASAERRLAQAVCVWLVGLVTIFVVVSRHWPMVGDAVLMHYIVLLSHHGMVPYRDIVDMNLPGTYLLEMAEMHLLGAGSVGWRLYDFSLLIVASFSMAAILRRQGALAGSIASALFILIHGRDGILMSGERDLAGAVLLLLSVALLFGALRKRRFTAVSQHLILGCGALLGFACCIKPTFLLMAVCLFCWAEWTRRMRAIPVAAMFVPLTIGNIVPVLGCVVFLVNEHSVPGFLGEMRGLIPYHATIDSKSIEYLFENCLLPIAAMIGLWAIAAWLLRGFRSHPERILLVSLSVCGLLSYVLQGKGFWYQRYPLMAFIIPLVVMDFTRLSKWKRWPRLIGLAGLGMGVLLASQCLLHLVHIDRREPSPQLLSDLDAIAPPAALSGHTQCMDTFGGCLDALYDGGIVQSTGFLYDCYLMGDRGKDKNGAVVADLRRHFWQEMAQNPPRVIVVTDSVCYEPERSFDKYEHWPEFANYLATNFQLVRQSGLQPPVHYWSRPSVPFGYRIYVRRSSAGG